MNFLMIDCSRCHSTTSPEALHSRPCIIVPLNDTIRRLASFQFAAMTHPTWYCHLSDVSVATKFEISPEMSRGYSLTVDATEVLRLDIMRRYGKQRQIIARKLLRTSLWVCLHCLQGVHNIIL